MKKLVSLVSMIVALTCSLAFGQAVGAGFQGTQVTGSNVGGSFMAYAYGGYRFKALNAVAAGSATMNVTASGVSDPNARCLADTIGLGNKPFNPFFVNNKFLILDNNSETVTATAAVSTVGSCSFTASFANAHSPGAIVVPASFGLYEAINDANRAGGGTVIVGPDWLGATSLITSATVGFANVAVEDIRSGPRLTYQWNGSNAYTPAHINAGVANNDVAGTVTLSGGVGSYTFKSSYTSAPVCVCADETAAAACKASATTTTLSLAGTTTDVLSYACFGNPN